MEKYNRRFTRFLVILIIPVLVLGMILNIIVPDQKKSAVENRTLQMFPELSLTDMGNGTFQSSLDSWFSDQFVGRNVFIHVKFLLSKLSGNKKIDDVYLAKGCLIEQEAEMNEKQFFRNMEAINTFAEKYEDLNISFMCIPNPISIQEDRLPTFASSEIQNDEIDEVYDELGDDVTPIDVRENFLEHANEYLYYKTDHHWTSLGAFYAFQQFAKETDLGSVSEKDYDVYPVTNNFKGTLSNKTGSVGLKDTIDIYVPRSNSDYIFTNVATGIKSRSLYSLDGLNSNDGYTVFLGGNTSLCRLEMNNNSDRRLVIFKDSYANAFIQFLVPYYRSITIVDPRYYYDDIDRVILGNVATDVLFLYNANTFVQDTSLADVLE